MFEDGRRKYSAAPQVIYTHLHYRLRGYPTIDRAHGAPQASFSHRPCSLSGIGRTGALPLPLHRAVPLTSEHKRISNWTGFVFLRGHQISSAFWGLAGWSAFLSLSLSVKASGRVQSV